MSQDFVADDDKLKPTVLPQNSDEMPPNREQLKHLLIGSPKGIRSTIQNLQVRGYSLFRLDEIQSDLSPNLSPTRREALILAPLPL